MLVVFGLSAMLLFMLAHQENRLAERLNSTRLFSFYLNADNSVATDNRFAHELDTVNASIQSLTAQVMRTPESWLNLERLALAHLDRARLTGEFADYQRADKTIDLAFTTSLLGSGPFLSRARIHLALHRTEAALSDLAQIKSNLLIDRNIALVVDELTGEALLQLDRTEEALAIFIQTNTRKPSFENAARLAQVYAKIGNHARAAEWLTRAEQRTVGDSNYIRAWLALQHGILALEQHHLDNAYHHFTLADNLFPRYWLIEEHLAEVDALSGRTAMAERRYRDIVDRTDIPQMKLALANVLETIDDESNHKQIQSLRNKGQHQLQKISRSYPRFAATH